MTLTRLMTAGALLVFATHATADEPLTLSEATSRALAKNHAIRVEREHVTAADARARGAAGAYDVQLKVDVNARHHRDPVNSLFAGAPDGRPAPSQNSFVSTMTLSQRLRTGAVASASTSVTREGTDALFSPFAPAYTSSLGVDLQQPLLRDRAIDPARTSLLVTALDRDRSSALLSRQAMETVADVEKAYWALVAARRELDVRRGNLTLAERQRIDTQARVDARTAAVSDLAQPTAEVERRRGELLSAHEALARAERALKLLIAATLDDPIWAQNLIPADAPESPMRPVDLPRALVEARRNRPEIAELTARGSQHDAEISALTDCRKAATKLARASGTLLNDRNVRIQ